MSIYIYGYRYHDYAGSDYTESKSYSVEYVAASLKLLVLLH